MKNRFLKTAVAFLLVFVLSLNATVCIFAQEDNITFGTIEPISVENATVLAGDYDLDTDASHYTSDEEQIVKTLRNAMVNCDPYVVIKYCTKGGLDSAKIKALLDGWFSEVFKETDKSYEGDYISYRYGGYATDSIMYFSMGGKSYCTIPFNFKFYTTAKQEAIVTERVAKVINGFNFNKNTTELQKCDAIYRYITDNVDYDYKNLNNPDYDLKYTAYAALVNKTSVCQGYASLFYRLAKEVGLGVRIVTGTSHGERHGWNIVKIGAYYYFVDATWDSARSTYEYYLKGSDDFPDHTLDSEFLTKEFKKAYPIAKTAYTGEEIDGCEKGHTYEKTDEDVFEIKYTCKICGDTKVEKKELSGEQLLEIDGVYYYYSDGEKQNITDLVKISGTWYYIKDGVWDTSIDTLHKINGKWFLIKGGIWNKTTGLVEYKGKTFYVKGGKWDSSINELKKLGGKWYFIKSGKWDKTLDSLHKLNGKWFLVKKGMWNKTTGIVEYKGKDFFVQGGKWKSQETLYKKSGKYLAVKGGKWTKGKTIVKYNGKRYYCNKGYAQTSYSGKVTIGGKKYTVKKGIVV